MSAVAHPATTGVRPGLRALRGTVRTTRPAASLRARFRTLEAMRHGPGAPRPRLIVHLGRSRPGAVCDLAHRPASSTLRTHAVTGPSLGFAWGSCGGRPTRGTAGAAVLAHRPPGARTRAFARR